jgi:hypothetical protein
MSNANGFEKQRQPNEAKKQGTPQWRALSARLPER